MITYINHPETESTKEHNDIMLNDKYIGYYIKHDEVITAFIELYGEMNAGDFETIEQLEQTIKELI